MLNITETLSISAGCVVALAGGGAKTRAALNLVTEMLTAGRTVISTSTVNMSELNLPQPSYFLVESSIEVIIEQLPGLLEKHRHVRLASERLRADKIRGIDPLWVPVLAVLPGLGNIIVEADGARHRALKAPNNDEPVIPDAAEVVFISADIDAVGKPLDEESTHRPEIGAPIMGLQQGDAITPQSIAHLLASPQGGLKGLPPDARPYFLLTGCTPENSEVALQVGREALTVSPASRGVVLMGAGHAGFQRFERGSGS